MKCKECNYKNPDDALCCNWCGHKFQDASASASPAPSLNAQEQPRSYESKPTIFENIMSFVADYKRFVVIGICLLSLYAFFSVKSFIVTQKYKVFEDKIAELSYPIYKVLVTGKQPDRDIITQVSSLIQAQVVYPATRQQVQEIQEAVKRGQERARIKIKRDYNVKCPYF